MQLNKTIRRASAIAIVSVLAPILALADVGDPAGGGFKDPLNLPPGQNAPQVFLGNIITFLLKIVGSLALIAIIWGGISYIISIGDESKVKKAKTIITMAVVGLVVVILAMTIINVVTHALGV